MLLPLQVRLLRLLVYYRLTLLLLRNERTTIRKVDLGELVTIKVTDLAVEKMSLLVLLANHLVIAIVANYAVLLVVLCKLYADHLVRTAISIELNLSILWVSFSTLGAKQARSIIILNYVVMCEIDLSQQPVVIVANLAVGFVV